MKIRILVINDDCLSAEAISNERLARGFGLNTRLITKADFLQSARYNRLMSLNAMLSEHVLFTLEDIYGSHYSVFNSNDASTDNRIHEDNDDIEIKRSFDDALFLDSFEFYSLQEHSYFDVEFISNNFDGIFFFFHRELSRERGLNQSIMSLLCAVDCPPVFMFNLALEKESLRYLVKDCEYILSEGSIAASYMNADQYGQFEYFVRVVLPKANRVYFINEEQKALVSRYYNLLNECLSHNRQEELKLPPFVLSCNGYLNFRRSEAILSAARSFRILKDYKEHGFDIKHIIGYTDSYLIKDKASPEPEDLLFAEPEFSAFGDSRMVLNAKHYIDIGNNSPEHFDNYMKQYTIAACGAEVEVNSGAGAHDKEEKLAHESIPVRSCSSPFSHNDCSSSAAISGVIESADSFAKTLAQGRLTTNEMLNESDLKAHLSPCSFDCPKEFKDEFLSSGRHRFTVAISSKFFGYNQTLGLDIRGINLIRSVCDAFPQARIVLFLNENLYSFLDDIPHSDTIIHEQTDCFVRANTIKMRQITKVMMGDVDSAGSLSLAVCGRINRSLNQHIKTQLFLEQEAFKGENAPCGMDRFDGSYYGPELQEKVAKLKNLVDDCFINLDYHGFFKTDVDLLISDHLHERVVAQANGIAAFKLKYDEDRLKEKALLTKEYLEAFLASTFDFDLVPALYVQFEGLSTLIANEVASQAAKMSQHISNKKEMLSIVGHNNVSTPNYFFAKEGLDYSEPCEQLPQSELLPSINLEGIVLHGKSVRDQILSLADKFDLNFLNDIIKKYKQGCASFENDLKQVFNPLYSSKHLLPTNLLDDSKDEELTLTPEEVKEMEDAGINIEIQETAEPADSSSLKALCANNLDVGDINNAIDAGFNDDQSQEEIAEAGKGLRVAQQSNFTYGKRYELQWSFLRFFLAMIQSCAHRPEISAAPRFGSSTSLNNDHTNAYSSDFKNGDRGSTMAYTMGEFDREFVRLRAKNSENDPTLRGEMEDRMYSSHEDTAIKPITLLEEYVPPLFKPMSLSLLSFGCSRGEEVMDLLSYFNGQSIKGVDISSGAISKARQMLKNMHRLNRFEMLVEFKKLYHLGSKFYEGYTAPIVNSMVQHKINLGTVELLAKNEWLCKSFGTQSRIFTEFLGNLRPSGGVVKQTGLIGYVEFMTSADYFEQRERFCSELDKLKSTLKSAMSEAEILAGQEKLKSIMLSEMRNTIMVRNRNEDIDAAHLQFMNEIDRTLSAAFRNVQSRSASFLRNLYNAYTLLNALYDNKVFERLPDVMYPDFSDRRLSVKMKTSESELSAAFNQAKSARDLMTASNSLDKSNDVDSNALSQDLALDSMSQGANKVQEQASASNAINVAHSAGSSQAKIDNIVDSYAFVERIKVEQYDALTAMTVLCRHPDTTKLTNAHSIYPFAEFEALLLKLSSMVRTGGFLCIFNANYRLEDTVLKDKFVRVFPFYENTKVTSLVQMDKDKAAGVESYDEDFKQLRISPNSSLNDYAFEFFHKLTQLHFKKDAQLEPHTICIPEDLRRMYENSDSFSKFGHTALFDGNEKRIIRKDIGSIFLKIED